MTVNNWRLVMVDLVWSMDAVDEDVVDIPEIGDSSNETSSTLTDGFGDTFSITMWSVSLFVLLLASSPGGSS